MAKAFAAGGAHVVIASRKLENCQTLADEIEAHPDCSGRAMAVAFNASDWDDCTALVELVVKEFGRIDVLVNNAGASPLYPSLAEISEELFDSEKAPRRCVDPCQPVGVAFLLRACWRPRAQKTTKTQTARPSEESNV